MWGPSNSMGIDCGSRVGLCGEGAKGGKIVITVVSAVSVITVSVITVIEHQTLKKKPYR